MAKDKDLLITKKQLDKINASREVVVDMLEIPGTGLHFSASFAFDLPEGENNFYKLTEMVDEQMNKGRQELLEKLANKLGVKVNFEQ